MSTMVDVPGLPVGVPIIDPTIKSMVEMGRWDLKAEEVRYKYTRPGTLFRVWIRSKLVPGVEYLKTGFEGSKETAVDTRIARVEDEDGVLRPSLRPESGYDEAIPAEEDGNLYRGVSWEEFQFIKEHCKIESNCSYNLGECEIGRTYFSEDPKMAAHYGGTFQPYHLQPTFDKPGYVIKIRKQPPEKIDAKVSIMHSEVALIGSVPVLEIIAVYEIRPYAVKPGDVELRLDPYGRWGSGFYEGSRTGPGVWVGYRKLEDIGDICSRMELKRMVEEQRAEPVKAEEPERFKIVGKRIPAEMREAIRELGKDMPIDFVEVEVPQGEGAPELTIETRCGSTKIDGVADKLKLSESLSQVSCKTIGPKKETA